MNKGHVKLLGVLATVAILSGCGATAVQGSGEPILSSADAKAMIQVTVTVAEPLQDVVAEDVEAVAALSN